MNDRSPIVAQATESAIQVFFRTRNDHRGRDFHTEGWATEGESMYSLVWEMVAAAMWVGVREAQDHYLITEVRRRTVRTEVSIVPLEGLQDEIV